MEIDQALEFVREHHRAVMLTRRRSGDPAMSPVSCAVDDDGFVVVSTRETAMKVQHVRRDARVSLCVFTDGFFGPWIQLDGEASILSLPDALEPLVDYYRRVAGEHPDWDDYRAAMVRDQRCLVRLRVTRAGPDVQG